MTLPKVPDKFDSASEESIMDTSVKPVKRDESEFDYVMHEQGNASSFFAMTENMVLDAEECR